MKNIEVARLLYDIADLLEMQNVEFKPVVYRKAARSIESMSEDVEDVWKEGKLEDIPGVGAHIALKISEFLKTGRLRYYDKLKEKIPVKVEELMGVAGLGPKRIMVLYKKLGIKSLKDLAIAAKKKKIGKLEGFGVKVEQDILRGIEFAKKKSGRFLLGDVMPVAEEIRNYISRLEGVGRIEITGSYRRRRETVGDIDILVTSENPKLVIEKFASMRNVNRIMAKGTTKSTVVLSNRLQVDLRVLKKGEYGSALQYFTGSKDHNIVLRKLALKKGLTLNEYGLFKIKGKKRVAGKTESEVYKKLGLDYIPPELRENKGEIEAAKAGKLPVLVEEKDVKADFQMHSVWSDGQNKVEEMVRAASKLGRKIIAMTDHVGQVGVTHPLDARRLKAQAKLIKKLNEKLNIRILRGAEVDILKSGRLALSRKEQEKLDIVLGAIHLATKMSKKEMTNRIIRAFENDRVHIFAHPTGRLLNQRPPYSFDFEKVCEAAKANDVRLELNAYPTRMDLSGELAKKAKEIGCKFSIGTDSHSVEHLRFLKFGVYMARRGWLEKKDILNCYSVKKIENLLRKK